MGCRCAVRWPRWSVALGRRVSRERLDKDNSQKEEESVRKGKWDEWRVTVRWEVDGWWWDDAVVSNQSCVPVTRIVWWTDQLASAFDAIPRLSLVPWLQQNNRIIQYNNHSNWFFIWYYWWSHWHLSLYHPIICPLKFLIVIAQKRTCRWHLTLSRRLPTITGRDSREQVWLESDLSDSWEQHGAFEGIALACSKGGDQFYASMKPVIISCQSSDRTFWNLCYGLIKNKNAIQPNCSHSWPRNATTTCLFITAWPLRPFACVKFISSPSLPYRNKVNYDS